jgi:hypothetical protein
MFLTSRKANIDLTANISAITTFVEGELTAFITAQYGYPVTAKVAFAKDNKLTIKLSVNEIDQLQAEAIVEAMAFFFFDFEMRG